MHGRKLINAASHSAESDSCQFCIYVFNCAGKFLLMLQSLKRGKQVDPLNGELHTDIVDFVLACELCSMFCC